MMGNFVTKNGIQNNNGFCFFLSQLPRRERAARERLKDKRLQSMTKQGRQAPIIDS